MPLHSTTWNSDHRFRAIFAAARLEADRGRADPLAGDGCCLERLMTLIVTPTQRRRPIIATNG
jgi:hypothetical protein